MSESIGQAGKPTGTIGRVLGRIMAWHNRLDNAWTLELLEIDRDENILEVGFGPGRAIKLLAAANPSARIAGVDHSEAMLSAARRTNLDAVEAGRVNLQCGSVEHMPFADGAFDKAFSINCIYFWPDPLQGLRELHRVLRHDGRLAVTVRDTDRTAYRPFRAENLVRLLTQAGFSATRVHRNGVASHPLICAIGIK